MAYELSGSIEAGNVTITVVDTPAFTNTQGGSISPDGNRIAAASQRHGGASRQQHKTIEPTPARKQLERGRE